MKPKRKEKLKALLFDFGGTLAFLDYELLAREFSREGRKLDALALEHAEYAGRAAIDRHLMNGANKPSVNGAYEQFFRGWMEAARIPEDEFRECATRFAAIHREATLWRVVRPGTFEALEAFKSAGYKLAIVSNAEGQVERDAKRFGLAPYFDVIIDSHIVGVAKPDPRIFQIALDRLGAAPDEVRFAGDIYSIDVEGARAAGIEARLIDQHERYTWVEHQKIRHVRELHKIAPVASEPSPNLSRKVTGEAPELKIMGVIRDQAEKMFSGSITTRQFHPLLPTGEYEEVADGVMFYRWFANVTAVKTREGLVLIDTGGYFNQEATVGLIRQFSPERVNTAIYTHGHVDHACGMPAIVADAQKNKVARPRVVGHRAVAARFDRYKRTTGYNSIINTRQFNRPSAWPTDYVYPDTYFDSQLNVVAGDHKFECHHARGETDDHCWVYVPQRKVLCTGDFIIWAAPNAGNPQKAQRYAREWADALRAMAKVGAEVLVPGHGYPVFGAIRVRQVLNDTASYLQSLYDQTIAMMNAGAPLDEVIHTVKPPPNLAEKPWLQAVYDEPEFIVRNIWRLEGGWYDGTPSNLKPAADAERAREIAALAGGVANVIARAKEKLAAGEIVLACHLADWAVAATPDDKSAHEARMRIYAARAENEQSTMAHGIFRSAVVESAAKAGIDAPEDKRSA